MYPALSATGTLAPELKSNARPVTFTARATTALDWAEAREQNTSTSASAQDEVRRNSDLAAPHCPRALT
jgi:hypothetical protein